MGLERVLGRGVLKGCESKGSLISPGAAGARARVLREHGVRLAVDAKVTRARQVLYVSLVILYKNTPGRAQMALTYTPRFELIPGEEYMDAGGVPHRDMQMSL